MALLRLKVWVKIRLDDGLWLESLLPNRIRLILVGGSYHTTFGCHDCLMSLSRIVILIVSVPFLQYQQHPTATSLLT